MNKVGNNIYGSALNYYEKFGAKYLEKLKTGEILYYIEL